MKPSSRQYRCINLRAASALVLAGVFAGCFASGCSTSDEPAKPTTVPIGRIQVSSPGWDGVGDDQIVATIDDIKIPAWRVRRALKGAPAGTTVEEALDLVIDMELIARKAAGDDGFVPDRKVLERALASRWVEANLIEGFSPRDVSLAMLQEAFSMPQIWAKFNHYDLYEVQSYQWICCTDPKNCDPALFEACMQEGEAPMRTVYESLLRDRPFPPDLGMLIPEYQKVAYRLSYQEFSFAFDKTAGFQRGAQHIDQMLVDQIMKGEPGNFMPPARSNFGWHVVYIVSHLPEVHGTLDDEFVRTEIATVFIERFRQQRFLELLAGLAPIDSLLLLKSYYENRPRPQTPPVYDVKVFRDTLREATADETSRKQNATGNM
ncbi:MAG TPA: hypothetical protein PKG98_04790 [Myxococcota bacterium]|nr:hypothetical protein [Myxococcota bacterium]